VTAVTIKKNYEGKVEMAAEMKANKQVATAPAPIEAIMRSPYFALGAADRQAGRDYR
jgi:hypothetical protein